jgi:hypothetical protein
MAMKRFLAIGCVAAVTAAAAGGDTWTFDTVAPAWARDVVPEPGVPSNRALRIAADKPHHTRVGVPGTVPAAFVAEARIRLVESAGAAPLAYLYGLTRDGFLAATLGSGKLRLFVWRGNEPSTSIGEAAAPSPTGRWVRVRMALDGGIVAAKAWADGTREPGWTVSGPVPGLAVNGFAVGAWISPKTPSTATFLFDDLALRPAVPEDRVAMAGDRAEPLALPAAVMNGIFESAPHIGVIAGDLAVAFDRASGALRHVIHRPSGRAFADGRQRRPLFRLGLTRWQKGEAMDVSADDFARVEWDTLPRRTLRATFRDGPVTGMVVRATAAAGDDGLVRFRLAVENPTDMAVARIRYPGFASPAALGGDAADDRLLFPHSHTDGIEIDAPGAADRSCHGSHPGDAAVQMAALYDSAAGLLIATHDAEGHCKRFDARAAKGRFVEVSVEHLRPEIPGAAETPYDTVLGAFTGDWRSAAALYKRWARTQAWCARRLTERDDVAGFLKDGAAGVVFGIGSPDGYNGSLGPNLEKLPGAAAAYRERAKVPHLIVVPYGWENRGTWAGIHYLPARPSDEAWRKANAALKAQGDRTAMLTSGYWWVLRRARTSNGPAFDDSADFERRKAMVVHRPDGAPWLVDAYDKVGTHGDWRGVSAKLCHGSAEASATMRDIFLATAALGTPLISFDQEIGGGQSAPCYAADHGHPPGYGSWMWTGFRNLCGEIRAKGRALEPEIGFFVENCGEMIIPVMATYWSRQFGVVDHGVRGGRAVGLFSYLYHEYVTAIGAAVVQGQGPQGATPSAGLRCQAQANNLVRGLIPCPFASDVPLETKDPRKAQIARSFFAFCEPFGSFPEFLVLGETLPPPAVTCGERDEWFEPKREGAAKAGAPRDRRVVPELPSVLAGRFAAPDGRVGTILVNATPEPQRATIAPPERGRPAVLHRADKSVEAEWDALPDSVEIALEPFGSRMLIAAP